MANPIIKIKRGSTTPANGALAAGEFAIDQAAKNLYLGVEVGGVTTNEIVGGSGTFATKAFVADAITTATGDLGTMSTQDADSVAITGGTINNSVNALFIYGAEISSSPIDNSAIGANIASTGAFTTLGVTSDITMSGSGTIDMNAGRITNLSAPINANDAARKTDLDSAISALGSVFHYVGDVSAYTDDSNPFELANIVDQSTGAYYRVDVAGTYTAGVGPSMKAKVGDAFVKTSTGWQKLDNVDAVVSGTANEIAVTGDENAGYTVSIDPVFSGRLNTAETDITDLETKTQNITATGNITTVTGEIHIENITINDPVNNGIQIGDVNYGASVIQGFGTKSISFEEGQIVGSWSFTDPLSIQGTGTSELGGLFVSEDLEVGKNVSIGTDPTGGSLTVTGNSTLTGNLSVTGNITDAVIDGGVY